MRWVGGNPELSSPLRGGPTKPKLDLLEAIYKVFPEVNLHWLIGGEGQMYRTDAELLGLAEQITAEEDTESKELLKKLIELQDHRIKQLEEELKKK